MLDLTEANKESSLNNKNGSVGFRKPDSYSQRQFHVDEWTFHLIQTLLERNKYWRFKECCLLLNEITEALAQ